MERAGGLSAELVREAPVAIWKVVDRTGSNILRLDFLATVYFGMELE